MTLCRLAANIERQSVVSVTDCTEVIKIGETEFKTFGGKSPKRGIKEYIEAIHPELDFREHLDVIVKIGDYLEKQKEKKPTVKEVAIALGWSTGKTWSRIRDIIPQYVAKSGRENTRPPQYLRVEDKFFWGKEEKASKFGELLSSLKEAIDSDPMVASIARSDLVDMQHLQRNDKLSQAVKVYHDCLEKLVSEKKKGKLKDAQIGSKAYRLNLTDEGWDEYYRFLRGEYHV